MTSTVSLDQLRRVDEPRFGGKSVSLGELVAAGVPVPPGFAVAVDASAPWDEIVDRYADLGENPPVAVRSSAVGEDSAEATFAGQYESYLWVRGAEDVCAAVRKCCASASNERAVSYRARVGGAAAAMGVAVQVMVDAAVSGVMFTCNPVSGDPSMVAINASWGLGLAVVGGEVTPDDFLVSKVTGEVVREHVHDKLFQYVPADGGPVRAEVPAERRHVRCLASDDIAALLELAQRVEAHFGAHQDVEWAVDQDGQLFVLQSRPVTALPQRQPTKPASALSLVMQNFGVPNASE